MWLTQSHTIFHTSSDVITRTSLRGRAYLSDTYVLIYDNSSIYAAGNRSLLFTFSHYVRKRSDLDRKSGKSSSILN